MLKEQREHGTEALIPVNEVGQERCPERRTSEMIPKLSNLIHVFMTLETSNLLLWQP